MDYSQCKNNGNKEWTTHNVKIIGTKRYSLFAFFIRTDSIGSISTARLTLSYPMAVLGSLMLCPLWKMRTHRRLLQARLKKKEGRFTICSRGGGASMDVPLEQSLPVQSCTACISALFSCFHTIVVSRTAHDTLALSQPKRNNS